MHSPLHAIIRSRATPWVLLVMTLAATAFPMVHPRPAPFVSPALAEPRKPGGGGQRPTLGRYDNFLG
jgi:hypothetical protein